MLLMTINNARMFIPYPEWGPEFLKLGVKGEIQMHARQRQLG